MSESLGSPGMSSALTWCSLLAQNSNWGSEACRSQALSRSSHLLVLSSSEALNHWLVFWRFLSASSAYISVFSLRCLFYTRHTLFLIPDHASRSEGNKLESVSSETTVWRQSSVVCLWAGGSLSVKAAGASGCSLGSGASRWIKATLAEI